MPAADLDLGRHRIASRVAAGGAGRRNRTEPTDPADLVRGTRNDGRRPQARPHDPAGDEGRGTKDWARVSLDHRGQALRVGGTLAVPGRRIASGTVLAHVQRLWRAPEGTACPLIEPADLSLACRTAELADHADEALRRWAAAARARHAGAARPGMVTSTRRGGRSSRARSARTRPTPGNGHVGKAACTRGTSEASGATVIRFAADSTRRDPITDIPHLTLQGAPRGKAY